MKNIDQSETTALNFDLFHTFDTIVSRLRSILFFVFISLIISLFYFFNSTPVYKSIVILKKISAEDSKLFMNLNAINYGELYSVLPYNLRPNDLINRFIDIIDTNELIKANLSKHIELEGDQLNTKSRQFLNNYRASYSDSDPSIIDFYRIEFNLDQDEIDIFPLIIEDIIDGANKLLIDSVVRELNTVKEQVQKKINYQQLSLSNEIKNEQKKNKQLLLQRVGFLEDQYEIAKALDIKTNMFNSLIGMSNINPGVDVDEMSSGKLLKSIDAPYYSNGYLVIEQEILNLKNKIDNYLSSPSVITLQSQMNNIFSKNSMVINQLEDDIEILEGVDSIIEYNDGKIFYYTNNNKFTVFITMFGIGIILSFAQAFIFELLKRYQSRE